ncbi:MAG TPA: hypothetical protein VMV98_09560 [Acidobacteriaceae bacterium]|nr:hypothetical protein [Acidobacteriaceae bacterium]
MALDSPPEIQRRDFLKLAGVAAASGLAHKATAAGVRFAIIADADNPIVSSKPVRWAVERLRQSLLAKGADCALVSSAAQAGAASFCIVVAGARSALASGFPAAPALKHAESVRLAPGRMREVPAVLVSAIDSRGFVYGLLELAERVQFGTNPMQALHLNVAVEEKPANDVRCIGRYFCSEIEDKPWYYDKKFWRGYLDLLVASRFNRFNLGFGLGYDFPKGVTGDYLHFLYPYLVEVPGYEGVRVLRLATPEGKPLASAEPLSVEERNKNMEALRWIAAETGKRGLQFQLGIWTHAYAWTDSPHAYHRIEGLTPATHAAYCRDALAILLRECPEIQGLTLRVHGESGIPEGSYPFWRTLFEAIRNCGRTIEIDMHAKGVNQIMIDMAADTGMPVKLGAKFSAEHQSLGYNQADIRAQEIPKPGNEKAGGPFSVSAGARSFTRYGYADFFEEGARDRLLYRLWPGTQRHLLSCDPEMAAGYARSAHFCGAAGIDICEPLTFKGREGSGHPGGRCAYGDVSLHPQYDWMKFADFYRVWGRRLYDPECASEVWRRSMRSRFGAAALPLESALAHASRLLPLVTSAHLPSASNHAFWPEIYDNMPIVLGSELSPYGDTPSPKCFGTVSPLDPQLFSTIVEHAQDLLAERVNPKYSPIEVAQWLEDYVADSRHALTAARGAARVRTAPEFRRVEEDVLIQNGLGAFFAAKLRSGVLYAIFEQTGSPQAGKLALQQYRKARDAWATMATRAHAVYQPDISYGDVPMRRGTWSDRVPAIDADIAAMQAKLAESPAAMQVSAHVATAVRAAMGRPARPAISSVHTQPASFHPGQPLALSLRIPASKAQSAPSAVRLCYRHVDQAERWLAVDMTLGSDGFHAAIPAEYTETKFPLQYYFELRRGNHAAWFYPAFNATLSNQPYYALSKRIL